jgi:hypothetical protein
MKPRIAVFLQPQHAEYDQIRQAAIEAEEIGADAIYNWDHFYPLYKEDGTQWGEGERREGKHFEFGQCYLAGERSQVKLI